MEGLVAKRVNLFIFNFSSFWKMTFEYESVFHKVGNQIRFAILDNLVNYLFLFLFLLFLFSFAIFMLLLKMKTMKINKMK